MIPANLGKVIVRYLENGDHMAYIAMEKNPEIKRYVGGPSKRTDEDLLGSLREYRPCTSLLAVADPATNGFIGRCGLLQTKASREVELYILLVQAYRRKGIASLVLPLLARLATANGKVAVAYVDPDNQASLRLMERLGAVCTGINTEDGYQAGHIRYVFNSV